jgi:hypothetical protein
LDALVKGVPNPDIQASQVCAGYVIAQATVQCVNQPFNASAAQGFPFNHDIVVESNRNVQAADVDSSGSGEIPVVCWAETPTQVLQEDISSNVCIPGTDTIYEGYDYCKTDGVCQQNWWLAEDESVVNLLYVDYVGYQWDKSGGQKARSSKCYVCTLTTDPNVDCGYTCVETSDASLCKPVDAACDSDVGWTK